MQIDPDEGEGDLDDVDESLLSKNELRELKLKRKEKKDRELEDKKLADEQRKRDNEAYRAARKIEKEQEDRDVRWHRSPNHPFLAGSVWGAAAHAR